MNQNTRELQAVTYATQDLNGTPSEVKRKKSEETEKWLTKANAAIEYWHNDLSVDYRNSLELIEATDLMIVAHSLRDGLSKYLFGGDAYLKDIDSPAWEGIHGRWSDIRATIVRFLRIITNYCNWLKELKDRNSQITDPLGLRNMVHQKDADTEIIIAEYAKLVSSIKPVIEEALRFV